MTISDKLAFEIYTIVSFHILAILILVAFSFFIYLKAKKTPLLFSYLAVVATFLCWMISKIFKTVSPTIELRWFFIVTQYIGINLLGLSLVVFAFTYTKNRLPSLRAMFYLSILPVCSMIIVMTNPLHMQFYKVFTFYKDRFGIWFYPTQSIQYAYWLVGIIMLARGFRDQKFFEGKRGFAMLFSAITLVPIAANTYYILFKLDVFDWVLPFPTFDFTPIAGSLAIMLFVLPALKFRFFDISPVSYAQLFDTMETGVLFYNCKRKVIDGANHGFHRICNVGSCLFLDQLRDFIEDKNHKGHGQIELNIGDTLLLCTKKTINRKRIMVFVTPITELVAKRHTLVIQNQELFDANQRLDQLAQASKALAIARTKSIAAQHVHDILGHSLTVVIGTTDLAAASDDKHEALVKLGQVQELLSSSLSDLKNALAGKAEGWGQTSLVKAIGHLKNHAIDLDFTVQGNPYELDGETTQAIFRLCQEAITNGIRHGKAQRIHIILRFTQNLVEVFAIDNGIGCLTIEKNYGLTGIESRILALGGNVSFGSDGESGFTIHCQFPIK